MVSHDVSEVYKLSQRVMVIEQGVIAKLGSPAGVFKAGQSSGKFSFAGEVLEIASADVVFAVTLLVGNQIVRVIATPDDVKNIKQGDRVMLMSKVFNPILLPVTS